MNLIQNSTERLRAFNMVVRVHFTVIFLWIHSILVLFNSCQASKISEEKLDKMVRKLKDKENFNERIEQAFSKYTLDIKNNLK